MAMRADLGQWYRLARHRVSSMVSEECAALVVPATPEWTVHDVLAHLAGITEDVVVGTMEGMATDPWTAAQVERGRHKSIAELVAMWEQYAPVVEGNLSSPDGERAARALTDISSHEADLLHALGRPLELPADVLAWAADNLRSDFDAAVAAAGLPPVEVRTPDVEWLRGRFGRRTAAEVCAYGWSADPQPYLDHWFVFGPAARSLGEVPSSG